MNVGYISDLDVGRIPIVSIYKQIGALAGGYTPKNKKCYCYPYNYVEIHNNYGESVDIRYELFDDAQTQPTNQIEFAYYHVLGENPLIIYIPCAYQGMMYNYNNMVQYASFPNLPWKYDVFANWSAQNSMSITSGFIMQGVNALISGIAPSVNGVVANTESGLNSLAHLYDKSRTPSKVVGNVQGNFMTYSASAGIYYKYVTAKAEYMHMIDDYFTRWGYLINETIEPSFNNRINFDYIKTRDINITGKRKNSTSQSDFSRYNIPNEDIQELNAMFDNGITIWHDETKYMDYNADNRPRT